MARPRAADYGIKRSAIVRQAAELFARNGYDGTSLNDIATACGTSKALLYHYYDNKEAVLADIIRTHLEDILAAVREANRMAVAEEPDARLRALIGAILDAYKDSDAEHVVQITELGKLPVEVQAELKAIERELVNTFATAIVEADPALAGRQDLIKPVTMSLFGMLNWSFMWFKPTKGMSREQYGEVLGTLLLGGLRKLLA